MNPEGEVFLLLEKVQARRSSLRKNRGFRFEKKDHFVVRELNLFNQAAVPDCSTVLSGYTTERKETTKELFSLPDYKPA